MNSVTLSSVIENGWSVYKKNIVKIVLLVLLISIPFSAIQYFFVDKYVDFDEITASVNEYMNKADEDDISVSEIMPLYRKLGVYYLISFVIASFFIIVQSSVMKVTLDSFRGEKSSFNQLFETGLYSFPKALMTEILWVLAMFTGFLFCFIPGLIFAYIFQFALYSVIISNQWGRKALHNSSLCTRKKPLLCFYVILLNAAFNFVVMIVFTIILSILNLSGIFGFVIDTLFVCIERLFLLLPVCCISSLYIGITDEIKRDNSGEGVVIDVT